MEINIVERSTSLGPVETTVITVETGMVGPQGPPNTDASLLSTGTVDNARLDAFLQVLVAIGSTGGTGALARLISPSFITPNIGVASGASLNTSGAGSFTGGVISDNAAVSSAFAGAGELRFFSGAGLNWWGRINASGFDVGNGFAMRFHSSSALGTADTTYSRQSAGVHQFGSGSTANALGSIAAANATLSTSLNANTINPYSGQTVTINTGTGYALKWDNNGLYSNGFAQPLGTVANPWGNVTASRYDMYVGAIRAGIATTDGYQTNIIANGIISGSFNNAGNFNASTSISVNGSTLCDVSRNITVANVTASGVLTLPQSVWHLDGAGKQRMFFNSATFLKSDATASGLSHVFRNQQDTGIAQWWANGDQTNTGNFTAQGTGTHTFGTTNTVTMTAGSLTASGNVRASGSSSFGSASNGGSALEAYGTTGILTPFRVYVNGSQSFRVTDTGVVEALSTGTHTFGTGNTVSMTNGQLTTNSITQQQTAQDWNFYFSAGNNSGSKILWYGPTNNRTSGSQTFMQINPIYNQTSGTASNTDLLINRTQTAVGSGTQSLIDAQTNSTSMFRVSNAGDVTTSGTYIQIRNANTRLYSNDVDMLFVQSSNTNDLKWLGCVGVKNPFSALTLSGDGKIQFQTGGFDRWQVGPANDFFPSVNNAYNVGQSSYRVLGFYGNTLDVTQSTGTPTLTVGNPGNSGADACARIGTASAGLWVAGANYGVRATAGNATTVPFTARGFASHTANLLECQTSTPTTVFSVEATGSIRVSDYIKDISGTNRVRFDGPGTGATRLVSDGNFFLERFANNGSVGIGTSSNYSLNLLTNGIARATVSSAGFDVTGDVTATGKIGIGITPVQPLDIFGGSGDGTTNEAFGLRIRGTNVTGNSATLQMGANGTTYSYMQSAYWGGGVLPIYLNPKGGQVFINATPTGATGSTVSLVSGRDMLIQSPWTSNAALGRLGFNVNGYGHPGKFPAYVGGFADNGLWTSGVGLTFNTVSGGDVSGTDGIERMRISSAGNVLIGSTTDSGAKLQVTGTTTITGGAGQAGGLTAFTVTDATYATFRLSFENGSRIMFSGNEGGHNLSFGGKSSGSPGMPFTERFRIDNIASNVACYVPFVVSTASTSTKGISVLAQAGGQSANMQEWGWIGSLTESYIDGNGNFVGRSVTSNGVLSAGGSSGLKLGNVSQATGTGLFGDSSSATLRFWTSGTERLVISNTGNVTASGSVTSVGQGYFANGAVYTYGNAICGDRNTNATSNLYLNYVGYNDGTTQFRDTIICDGKTAAVATFTGITKAATFAGSVAIGSGIPIQKVLSATATLDYPSIASNDTHTLTITVTGAAVGDTVCVGVPSTLDAGLIWCASVTAADTVSIRMHNSSGGGIDPASGVFRATVIKF